MQFRAWFFGFLGFVFAVTGILWYEIRKAEIPQLQSRYSYNALTDPPDKVLAPLDDLVKQLPYLIEMEKVRSSALGLAAVCFFLAWRNSIGDTQQRRHDEIMGALVSFTTPQPISQPYSRLDDPASVVNVWRGVRDQSSIPQGAINWNDLTPQEQHTIRVERGKVHSYERRVIPPENDG